MKYSDIKILARENRKNPTEAESYFWALVRNRNLRGLKFNRQYVIEYRLLEGNMRYFIADFYCHDYRLIIELDGPVHRKKLDYDLDREAILRSLGYSILRFDNEEILNDWPKVEKLIFEKINSPPSPHL